MPAAAKTSGPAQASVGPLRIRKVFAKLAKEGAKGQQLFLYKSNYKIKFYLNLLRNTLMKMKYILSTCLFFLWSLVNAQTKVPETIIGNWIDERNNNWEYGFYEKFAVYNNDFWEYGNIQIKKNRLEIQLKKGTQIENLKLTLSKKNNRALTIARNQEKPGRFKLNGPSFFPYTKADDKTFKNSGFHSDTVTIIGYYRNLNQYQKMTSQARPAAPFKVTVPNIMLDQEVEHFADFDSLGRFKIKFPVLNTQVAFLDWGRLTQENVVEPGETIFLFADMADYIPKESEKDMATFENRPKQVLYMGKEARLHNEFVNYKGPNFNFNREETVKKVSSDMDYLAAANSSYQDRLNYLETYFKSMPTLSNRFKDYRLAYEKYLLAFHLMQYRFDKMNKEEIQFGKGYMEFVNSTMDFNDEKLFTLVQFYSTFIRDYIDYYRHSSLAYKDEKTGQIRRKEVKMEVNFRQIDSLIQNRTLNELLKAKDLYLFMDVMRAPLSVAGLNLLHEQITIPPIKDYILQVNNHYLNLDNKKISYLGSLKNTDHLKEAKDADLLFKQLIAPYKGKVIYIDFWGTWCGPCIKQMPFVGGIKNEFAGKDVIFMYFANRSSEKSWHNVIKQMDLAGENVVHYRLPEEQQAMIERKLSVNSFPTYLLIGKDGNLIYGDVPQPEMKSELVSEINKLLNN